MCSGTNRSGVLAYVTGAAGFLGSHLVDALLAARWHVVGIDNLSTGSLANLPARGTEPSFTLVTADVSLPWDEWIAGLGSGALERPDVILHLASPASPVDYGGAPLATMAANALGTMHAVALARATGARVVFASTSESYGDPQEHPQRETYWGHVNPVGVRACYDESKRYGEAYVTSAVRAHGIDGRVMRIFNTYGPRMQAGDGRVVPNFCVAALRGEPLELYGGGVQTRSFCYVDDLIDGIVRVATRPALAGAVINLGNSSECTIRELAEIVARLAGVALRTEDRPLPPDDPTRRRPDIARARELLEWEPAVPLEMGLARTLDYFRNAAA